MAADSSNRCPPSELLFEQKLIIGPRISFCLIRNDCIIITVYYRGVSHFTVASRIRGFWSAYRKSEIKSIRTCIVIVILKHCTDNLFMCKFLLDPSGFEDVNNPRCYVNLFKKKTL